MFFRSTLVWLLILYPALAQSAGAGQPPGAESERAASCPFVAVSGGACCMWLCGNAEPVGIIFCCARPVEQPPVQRPTVPPYKLTERRLAADAELAVQPCHNAAEDVVRAGGPQRTDHPAHATGRTVRAVFCIWNN